MAPAPSWSHQEIVGAFYRYLYTYVTSSDLGGVFVAPIDVELAPNVVFQPDVVVLLKESRDKFEGTPYRRCSRSGGGGRFTWKCNA